MCTNPTHSHLCDCHQNAGLFALLSLAEIAVKPVAA